METASRLLFISAEVDIEDFKLLRNLLPTFMIRYCYMENLCLQAMNAAPFSQQPVIKNPKVTENVLLDKQPVGAMTNSHCSK